MLPKSAALLLVAAVWLGPASEARATDLHNVLVDYTLTSWGQKDGLPSSVIWAIAQDKEGYLWLGTDAGPVRFDGARFTSWDELSVALLPKAPVRALCAARDGSLWFGFDDLGGVSRLHDGELRTYGTGEGLPEGAVTVLLEEPGGTMLVGNRSGLYALRHDRWEPSGKGLPPGQVYSAFIDRSGRLLVGTPSGVFSRAAGQDVFESVDVGGDTARGISEDRSGSIWVTDPTVGFRKLGEPGTPQSREEGRGSRLLHDSTGNLWVGTSRRGLWRVRFDASAGGPTIETTTTLTGFSDDGVTSLIQDSEGNLWAGTLDGLNRLTPHKITPVMDLGLVSGVEITPDGNVWVGTVDSVIRFSNGNVGMRHSPERLPAPMSAMHGDERGTLWVAMGGQLIRFDAGRRSAVDLPGAHPPRRINGLTSDSRGGLWISDMDQGLLHWSRGRLESFAFPIELRRSRLVTTRVDRTGRIWLAFENERVAAVDPDGTLHAYGSGEGLDAGVCRDIYEDDKGVIWLAGSEGLSRFKDGRFSTLGDASGFPAESLTAVVSDDEGYLWLGIEGSRIVRVAQAEFEKAFADPAYQLHYRVFDKFDGFAGTPRWFGHRAAVRTLDGRLWFVAGRGVSVIDPRDLPGGPPAPLHVRIERVIADDRRLPVQRQVVLPPRTGRIQIDYAVLNLTPPLKTHFRYRLQGFDANWIEAGPLRQALYTNLPPGQYEFRVVASNADGTWDESGGALAFAIQPVFFQRTWFFAACVLGLAAAVAAAWGLHVRRVRQQFSLLIGERVRLSREIHDTLLQGLFGVALRCDAIAGSLDSSDPWIKEQFLRMRKDVQDYIAEARQSIQDLRSPWLVGRDLPGALREAGERATAGTPVKFEFAIVGSPRACPSVIEQQLLRIGQEGFVNAVRHSGAHALHAVLQYDDARVTLRISDDGRGFDPDVVRDNNGHYGLTGMKERAQSVGGTLNVTSGAGRGAEIEAIVPA